MRLSFLAFLVAPLLLGVLMSQPAASGAGAETEIVCAGPLPFSQAEMEQALHARRHLLGRSASVVVRAEAGHTRVQVGGAEREVELGGRTGEDAARMVAVLALDLAQADAPITLSSKAPRPPLPSPAQGQGEHGRAFRAGLTLLGPFDQAGWVAHLEPTVDVAVDGARGLGAFVTAGYRQVSATRAANSSVGTGTTSLQMHEIPIRAGLSYRRRWLELRLGAMVRPRLVEGAGSHRGATWGAVVAAARRWALTPKLAVVLAAGLDVSRNRMVFTVDDQTVLSTSWLAPWLGVGLAWGAAP